ELDETFLRRLRRFLDAHDVAIYSEHLSACGDSRGQLYDLLPLPFTDEAVAHAAARIRHAQDVLGRRIAVENISYYAAPFQAMDEIEFVNAVLAEADCDLLLDVNNIVVNATNHGYDAHGFLRALPSARVRDIHVAGHRDEAPDLKIDTHGAAVSDPVWALLAEAYRMHGRRPTLLARDFNFPPFAELVDELDIVRRHLADAGGGARHVASHAGRRPARAARRACRLDPRTGHARAAAGHRTAAPGCLPRAVLQQRRRPAGRQLPSAAAHPRRRALAVAGARVLPRPRQPYAAVHRAG